MSSHMHRQGMVVALLLCVVPLTSRGNGADDPQPTPLARDWRGHETLDGYDKLSFEFGEDGSVIMHDAVGDAKGTWRRAGDALTLRFANGRVVYNGVLRGDTLNGIANNERTRWAFSVASGKTPPLAPLPRDWSGSETLEGYGKLAFELHDDGVAIMHDAVGDARGTWRRAGNALTLRFANGRVVYHAVVHGDTLSGIANNERTSWAFSVKQTSSR